MLSQFCIKRPIFSTVMAILIILAGLISIRVLPISQYPNITPPSVMINASYDGADILTLSRTVAQPIEAQLSGIQGLLYYRTTLRSSGEVRIDCTFDIGVNPNDAVLEINNRVRTVERKLPQAVRNVGVTVRKRSSDNLLRVILTSPDGSMSPIEMADYANVNIVDELKRVEDIGDVTIFGNVESSMRIWVDPLRMAKLKVTTSDIQSAISSQNMQYGIGRTGSAPTVEGQQLFYTVTGRRQLINPDQFRNIVIKSDPSLGVIHLRDVARVEVGNRNYEFVSRQNGAPAANIAVFLQSGGNALAAANAVKNRLKELSVHFPKGKLAYNVTDDTTVFVKASIREVLITIGEAFLLVLGVVFLFLQSWRATLIPMISVPVSLIGCTAGLWLCGFSINTLTLFAMTLAIGIVVDDAIVVLENVDRLMTQQHLPPRQAAQQAMKEVSSALIAIVLVLSAVFIPVAFLGGMAGELYRQFAVTVAMAVIISGFNALTLTPALCALFLKPGDPSRKKPRLFLAFNQILAVSTDFFIRVVSWLLAHGKLCFVLLLAVSALVWELMAVTPTSFIPTEDQGLVRMTFRMPDGTAFPRTYKATTEIADQIRKLPGIDSVVSETGRDSTTSDFRPDIASFTAKLKPWDERSVTASDIRVRMQSIASARTDGVGTATLPAAIPGLGSTNGFTGFILARGSDNPRALQAVTDDFIAALREHPELTSLRSFLQAESPQLSAEVDEEKAAAMGVDIATVYNTLGTLIGSTYVNDFPRDSKLLRVIVQADAPYRMNPQDIGRAWVRSNSGEMIPLSTLVTVKRTSGPISMTRLNGYLAARFMGAAAQGVSSGSSISLVEKVADEVLPEGYTIGWVDQAWQEKRIGSSSSTAFGFGILVVFLILAALFERWSLPVAVVLALPFSLLGAFLAVDLRGFNNDIYFQIGLLVLIGLATKNAILIVEFALQKMAEGEEPGKAAVDAARLRFRPILMTSLAFMLGVLPLAIASGAGSAARRSMGTGVLGGMLLSTFIATLFVPVFFTWFASLGRRRSGGSGSPAEKKGKEEK
ncbi:efflux RND transporter permease subunit [Mesosutterella sp. OilRF-GAM-744-9]|uniref:Efflux pump membrane transporter n=1 Tax=Mesosutterella porci TaxID=2915351 RepID=A0ABS9MP01_9BURK|nr:efflux RND transporter permease subunit [Mesosutterella sp. oilRF-744-WT-GAM-9]MCG5030336.1 efflux RND transporter permease subunit [Mesosutterella sp. oilRF-744-WT-GAM-9]